MAFSEYWTLSTIYLQRRKLRWQFCYSFFTHFNALGSIICSIWLIHARQPVPFKTFVNNAVCNTLDSCPFKFVLLRRKKKVSERKIGGAQSHYRKVPRWGVSSRARHNWKCFLAYKHWKWFFKSFIHFWCVKMCHNHRHFWGIW